MFLLPWGSLVPRAERFHQVPGENKCNLVSLKYDVLSTRCREDNTIGHPQNLGIALKAAALAGGRAGLLRRPAHLQAAAPSLLPCPMANVLPYSKAFGRRVPRVLLDVV